MHDDELDERPDDAAQQRAVLRQVAAYRELCARVRKSGTHSLIFGGIMLSLWYLIYGQRDNLSFLSIVYLSLGLLEFGTGLLNRFFPSAEGILLDGLVLLAFGGINIYRQYLVWQLGGRIDPIWLMIAAYWFYQGFNHVRAYADLQKAFSVRPSRANLRWFEELLRDIRNSDPEADPQSLNLPTQPRLLAKLLGDTAIFLLPGSGDVVIADRARVELHSEPSNKSDQLPTGYLVVEGLDFGAFKLHPENWKNYAAWKAEGGQQAR